MSHKEGKGPAKDPRMGGASGGKASRHDGGRVDNRSGPAGPHTGAAPQARAERRAVQVGQPADNAAAFALRAPGTPERKPSQRDEP